MSTPPSQVPRPPGGGQPQLGGYATPRAQTNTLAVVSFVASLASFFAHIIPLVGGTAVAILAIITGFIARGQIKRTGEQGMWMANAGIIIGFIHLAGIFILVLLILFFVFVLGVAFLGIAAHGGSTPSPIVSPIASGG